MHRFVELHIVTCYMRIFELDFLYSCRRTRIYYRAPRPQALIVMKIAPAARTYGLHLYSEVFFIFFRLFYLRLSMRLTDRRKTAKNLADNRKN